MRTRRGGQGQSLVEFGLVLPILVMLVVLVADFGRIFATGLLLEASVRNAAETVSNEYLADWPGRSATPPLTLADPAPTGDPAYYGRLHQKAVTTFCSETQELPSVTYDSATAQCTGMPFLMVCIHDSQDTNCDVEAQGAVPPPNCTDFAPAPSNTQGGMATRWVEVRACYRFTPLLALPILSFSDFWLQRTRSFVVPCYYVLGEAECGT